jgi:hypothetical protein
MRVEEMEHGERRETGEGEKRESRRRGEKDGSGGKGEY